MVNNIKTDIHLSFKCSARTSTCSQMAPKLRCWFLLEKPGSSGPDEIWSMHSSQILSLYLQFKTRTPSGNMAWWLWRAGCGTFVVSPSTTAHEALRVRDNRTVFMSEHLRSIKGLPKHVSVMEREPFAGEKRTNGFWEWEKPSLLDCGLCKDVWSPWSGLGLSSHGKIHLVMTRSSLRAEWLQLTPRVENILKATLILSFSKNKI